MKFEPFTLCQYECTLVPARSYRIWGAFTRTESLGVTLDRLRFKFPASVLVVDGDGPDAPPDTPSIRFESRYTIDQHNGEIVRAPGKKVRFLNTSKLESKGFVQALGDNPSAALFCLDNPSPFEPMKELFGKDVFGRESGLGVLRHGLFSVIKAYLGFDADSFFTFETSDPQLAREAMDATESQGVVFPSLRLEATRE